MEVLVVEDNSDDDDQHPEVIEVSSGKTEETALRNDRTHALSGRKKKRSTRIPRIKHGPEGGPICITIEDEDSNIQRHQTSRPVSAEQVPAQTKSRRQERNAKEQKNRKRLVPKKNGTVHTIAEDVEDLPKPYQALFRAYEVLDKAICWWLKHSTPTTLHRCIILVQSMLKDSAESSGGGDSAAPAAAAAFDAATVRALVGVSGGVLALQWVPAAPGGGGGGVSGGGGGEYELEVVLPVHGGAGRGHARRRAAAVARGLREFYALHGEEKVPTPVPLPPRPASLGEAARADSFLKIPAPLRNPAATGSGRGGGGGAQATLTSWARGGRLAAAHPAAPLPRAGDQDTPFNEDFVNNTPANQVPASEEEAVKVPAIIDHLKQLPFYSGQIAHVERLPPRTARRRRPSVPYPEEVVGALEANGVAPENLFEHQASAVEAAARGRHVALSTGTASGKSLAYTLPCLAACARDPRAAALWLFPTKALGQDQYLSLRKFIEKGMLGNRVKCAAIDGDTGFATRDQIRESANIIISNPDLLHTTILPDHQKWERVISNLRFVVVDEAHTYTGAFGSHISYVLRRLLRLVLLHDPHRTPETMPQFICCSATMANPKEHFKALLPLEALGGDARLTVIDQDFSPRGPKEFVIWNPPLRGFRAQQGKEGNAAKTNFATHAGGAGSFKEQGEVDHCIKQLHQTGADDDHDDMEESSMRGTMDGNKDKDITRRRSAILEMAMLFCALIKQRIRTLAFCKTRKLTEMVLRYALSDLKITAPELCQHVKSYRGGYTAADRRRVEGQLFSGTLLGATATSALELGVDVGELDATLHLGFPGGASSLWQQAGRAGRSGRRPALAALVCFDGPVDQYYARRPRELFDKPPERAILDSCNETVAYSQILCASAEAPLFLKCCNERMLFGQQTFDISVSKLIKDECLRKSQLNPGLWEMHPSVENPRHLANLRQIDPITFKIVDDSRNGEVIDTIEYRRAFFELFEGAIYLHQASQYRCKKLNLDAYIAHVEPTSVKYYTASMNYTDVNITKKFETLETSNSCIHTGCADVVDSVTGYKKIWQGGGGIFEMVNFSIPPLEYSTRAFWIDITLEMRANLERADHSAWAAIHAVSHALLAVVQLFLSCDSSDLETLHGRQSTNRPTPSRILIYDKRPGGLGGSEAIFQCVDELVEQALKLVVSCTCETSAGCPSCIHNQRCTGYNHSMDKRAAVLLLSDIKKEIIGGSAVAETEIFLLSETELLGQGHSKASAFNSVDEKPSHRNSPEPKPKCFICHNNTGDNCSHQQQPVHCQCNKEQIQQARQVPEPQGKGQPAPEAYTKDSNTETAHKVLVEESPRKMRRLGALNKAKAMGGARARASVLRAAWVPSLPHYRPAEEEGGGGE